MPISAELKCGGDVEKCDQDHIMERGKLREKIFFALAEKNYFLSGIFSVAGSCCGRVASRHLMVCS